MCIREDTGEASVAVRMGGTIEQRKVYRLECRDSRNGRRQNLPGRNGEGRQGSTVSKEFMHVRTPGIGTWEVSILPLHGAAEERGQPESKMNGMEKSDSVIVLMRAANKGTEVLAELTEGRTGPKGRAATRKHASDTEAG